MFTLATSCNDHIQCTVIHGPDIPGSYATLFSTALAALSEAETVLICGCAGGESDVRCCCSSAGKLCPTLGDPMDGSTPGYSVFHCLTEFAQTHVHWFGDAIQPSHSWFSSSPSLSLSQYQSFPMSQLFSSGGQSIGALVSASVLPMNIQGWFPLGLTGFISLQPHGFLRVFPKTTVWKHQFFSASAFFMVQLWYLYMTTGKTIALTLQTSVSKGMSLLFNMLSRFVIAFFQSSKHILILWLQSPSSVILEPKKRKEPLFPFFPHL